MKELLQKLKENTLSMKRDKVKNVLVVIMVEGYPIGDSVLVFSGLRAISKYFNGQQFDLLTTKEHYTYLQNSPLVKNYYFDMEGVDFPAYDLIVNFSTRDIYLAEFLNRKYREGILNGSHAFGVHSLFLKKGFEHNVLFEFFSDFERYIMSEYQLEREFWGHELHMSAADREWGNEWFRSQGVKENEKVIVVLDGTSGRSKLLPMNVYFDVLRFFMTFENTRILIFDPDNLDKRSFYQQMLENEHLDQFIFVKRHGLRKDFCLLASDFVHMVFGPCTGLLHCAEGIYNTMDQKGVLSREWPMLIAYMGPTTSPDDPDKWYWWGDTHVECLYTEMDLREPDRRVVKRLAGPGRFGLPCQEFKAGALIRYLTRNHGERLREWGMLPALPAAVAL
jgi:ADP-heptose:LPS heptosyltransferase